MGRERIARAVCYVWAAPATLVGLALALVAVPLGATARIVRGTVEVGGGRIARVIARLPRPLRFSAITFGHVIVGASHETLARCRAHERIHVGQYERWGVLFFVLYLASSLLQLLRGRDPYGDNWFERQAFEQAWHPPEADAEPGGGQRAATSAR